MVDHQPPFVEDAGGGPSGLVTLSTVSVPKTFDFGTNRYTLRNNKAVSVLAEMLPPVSKVNVRAHTRNGHPVRAYTQWRRGTAGASAVGVITAGTHQTPSPATAA